MDRVESLAFFIAILEKGGVAAAGRHFGLSPAAASERLAALERHYGVTLLNRTTRTFSLTEEGEKLLAGGRDLVAQAAELEARVRRGTDDLVGRIRLAAPEDFGNQNIVPLADRFLEQHPNVEIEVHLGDEAVDLIRQGFDFAVRYGEVAGSTLTVQKIAPNHRMICAAPAYIEAHGEPKTPADLAAHNCLLMQFGGLVDQDWWFNIDGRECALRVSGNRLANSGAVVRQWCIRGHGLARKSYLDVHKSLRDGQLVEVLASYRAQREIPLQIVYPRTKSPNARTQALMASIHAELKKSQPTDV